MMYVCLLLTKIILLFLKTAARKKMDRYQRVEKPRVETPIDENEIRITSQGRMRNYITYAMTLLQVCLPLILPSIFHFLL